MKLSVIFNALASGELHNLWISDNREEIRDEFKEQVLRGINLGLLDLYTRFMLSKRSFKPDIKEGIREYTVDDNRLLEVLNVQFNGSDLAYYKPDGYFLLNTNLILLGFSPKDGDNCEIIYKAKPNELTEQDIIDDTDVELPMSYLNALLYFVSSRLFTSIPNQLDGDLHEGVRWRQRYESELMMLNQQGIDVDGLDDTTWFIERGFV